MESEPRKLCTCSARTRHRDHQRADAPGIDVSAKAEIYKTLGALADAGKSLLTFSSELPELLLIADRILVMRGRRIVGSLSGAERTEECVMELAAGQA